MSINTSSSILDMLNPCRVAPTQRRSGFIQAESQSYQNGAEIRMSLPMESMDLSTSYFNCNIALTGQTPEVSWIINLARVGTSPAATSGTWQVAFGGIVSPTILNFNATGTQILDAIALIATAREYTILATNTPATFPYPAATNNLQTGISLVWSNFITVGNENAAVPSDFGLEFVNNSMIQAGVSVPYTIVEVQAADFAYPRLEYNAASIIQQLRIDVGNETIITINDVYYLASIVKLMETSGSRYYNFAVDSEGFNGVFDPVILRVQINIADVVDLFKLILPMDILRTQIRISMTLTQPNLCLIHPLSQGTATTGNYIVSNVEYHYSRINFSLTEQTMIRDAISKNSLILPFFNWTSYSTGIPQNTSETNVLFNPAVKDLLAIFAVMVPTGQYTSTPSNARKTSTFVKNLLQQSQLRIGSQYFPLNPIRSINPSKNDVTDFAEQFIDASVLINFQYNEDQKIFYNYGGNDPSEKNFIQAFNVLANPTFVIGIHTVDTAYTPARDLCSYSSLSGINCSNETNVSLNLSGMQPTESFTCVIYSLFQAYLVFGEGSFSYVH